MEESEKGNTSVESKSKKVLLDEEIGKEFLSSWKSMSVAKDDGMDFSFEPLGKSKKNAFNFDKLDMDFSLDGDFNKLSSFKVDMPDLDFSCPPKRNAKAKEGNKGESSDGNGQRKKDTFSISFDFNEMDSFDFGSSLTRGEKTPAKDSMAKEVAPMKLDDQGTKIHLSGDLVADDDNEKMLLSMKSVEASEGDDSGSGATELTSARTNLLNASTFGIKTQQNEERDSLDIKTRGIPEKTNEQAHLFEKDVKGGLLAKHEEMRTPNGAKVQKDACSGKIGRDQDVCNNMVYQDPPCPRNLPSMSPHASDTTESRDGEEKKNVGNVTSGDSIDPSKQGQGQLDIEDAPTLNILKKTESDAKLEGHDENLVKKLDLATGNRDQVADKMMPTNNKSGRECSKFFKSFGDNVNQSAEAPRLIQSGSKRIVRINTNPADKIRGSTWKDAAQESKVGNDLDKISRELKRGPNVAEPSKTVRHTSKTGLLNSSMETSKVLGTQSSKERKSTGLSTVVLGNPRIMSPPSKKLYSVNSTATCNLSSLSSLRAPGNASKQLGSRTLAVTPSTQTSEENTEIQRDIVSLTEHPGGGSEKKKQLMRTPSLKRKTYETSDSIMMSYSPLKRLSESPVESRSPKESSQKLVVGQQMGEARCENRVDGKSRNALDDHSPSQVEIPSVKNMEDFELTALVENDGNLEKADKYTKELEGLCNMLKKKQDEAKELLVRAIVNNNHLLMLNHPIFDQKIRTVQKFASRLMAKEVCK